MSPAVRARLHAEWLTTDELAAWTGWSTARIKQKAHRGDIDSVKKGGILLFWRGDFAHVARQDRQREDTGRGQADKGGPQA